MERGQSLDECPAYKIVNYSIRGMTSSPTIDRGLFCYSIRCKENAIHMKDFLDERTSSKHVVFEAEIDKSNIIFEDVIIECRGLTLLNLQYE